MAGEPKPVLEELDEVLIVGKQPGPALWQVKSGTHTLWILAEVNLLPQRMKWQPKQVEQVLASAQELLVIHGHAEAPRTAAEKAMAKQMLENDQAWYRMAYLPDGQTLRDALPTDMYDRFEAAKASFGKQYKGWERMTPYWANNRLWNSAFVKLELRPLFPVADKVVQMARNRKVKVRQIAPRFLAGNPTAPTTTYLMNICPLDGTLAELDIRGARWITLANAWSVGDVKRLKQLMRPTPGRIPHCNPGVEPSTGAAEDGPWLAPAERSLATNTSALAVVEAAYLLRTSGLLDALRNRGYEVIEP
ncbi:MAG: TraB/GumN family protein [Pseudomonadota bacterium]